MSEPIITFNVDPDVGFYAGENKEGHHWDATAGERDPFFPGHMSGAWVKDETDETEFDYTKRKKKDTKRWCKGKHGVAHKIFHGKGKHPYNDEDKCAVCDKVVKTHWRIRFLGWDDSCHKLTRNPKNE